MFQNLSVSKLWWFVQQISLDSQKDAAQSFVNEKIGSLRKGNMTLLDSIQSMCVSGRHIAFSYAQLARRCSDALGILLSSLLCFEKIGKCNVTLNRAVWLWRKTLCKMGLSFSFPLVLLSQLLDLLLSQIYLIVLKFQRRSIPSWNWNHYTEFHA